MEVLRHAVERPGLWIPLAGRHDKAAALRANVEGRVRVSKDRQLASEGGDLRQRLGDDVMVLERDDRELDTGQSPDLAGPLAGRDDHGLSPKRPLGSRDRPAAVRAL